MRLLVAPALLALAAPAVAQVHELDPTRAPYEPSRAPEPMPTPASADLPGAFRDAWNALELGPWTAAEHARAAESDRRAGLGPYRVGLVRSLGPVPFDLAGPAFLPLDDGADAPLRTLSVRSNGARGLRLHFVDLDLPAGATLVVYGRQHGGRVVARGPFRGTGPLGTGEVWTPWVPGDTAWVEVRSTEPPPGALRAVLHFDRHPGGLDGPLGAPGGDAMACHGDGACEVELTPSLTSAFLATAQYSFVKDGEGALCSGTLLNDLDDGPKGKYFLTGDHCVDSQASADSMEVVFGWHKDECQGTLPDFDLLPRVNGAILLADDEAVGGTDASFVRLVDELPAGVQFAGWTTADLPQTTHGFHHPKGGWKRYTHWLDSWHVFCQFWDSAYYHFVETLGGTIEGGSSGSGLFNYGGQLTGNLYGYCGIDPDCNPDDWRGLYGEFENTYELECNEGPWTVADWLAIGATFTVDAGASADAHQKGTPSEPMKHFSDGYSKAWDGGRIRLRGGTHPGTYTLTKELVLFGEGDGSTVLGG